ncbi:hypothetical protein GGF50DRAFT_55212 [Schizophyllum commune]
MEHIAIMDEAARLANMQLNREGYVPDTHTASLIAAHTSRLEEIKESLCSQLSKLQAQIDAVHLQAAVNRSVLAPIRRLPQELLADIFLRVAADTWTQSPSGRMRLQVSEVCHMWRLTALATPALWANIHFQPQNEIDPSLWAEAIQRWFHRSQNMPMRLFMDIDRYYTPFTEAPEAWDIYESIATRSSQLRSLSLCYLPVLSYREFEGKHWPILRELRLDFGDIWSREFLGTYTIPLHAFEHAPQLQKLRLQYLKFPETLVVPSSWTLTHLSIVCGDREKEYQPDLAPCLQAILSCAPHLLDCRIATGYLDRLPIEEDDTSQRTIFPILKRLSLSQNALDLMFYMTTPAIESIVLTAYDTSFDDEEMLRFIDLLQRSSFCSRLRSLSMRSFSDTSVHLIRCLELLPSLTTLTLCNKPEPGVRHTGPVISGELLKGLTRDETRPETLHLLPRLSHLTLVTRSSERHPRDGILDREIWRLAQSRQKRGMFVDGHELAVVELHTDYPGRWPPEEYTPGDGDVTIYRDALPPSLDNTDVDSLFDEESE